MHNTNKQTNPSPPPVVWTSISQDLDRSAPEGHVWMSLHRVILRYHEGKIIEERLKSLPLFLNRAGYQPRSWSLSPDGNFYHYETLHATYCGRVSDPPSEPIVLGSLYRLRFSPNSRFLCGYGGREDEMVVVECATRRVRRLATPEYSYDTEDNPSYRFGWYPDSRHIWYQEDTLEVRRDYRQGRGYKQDVLSGRRWLLRGRQLEKVYSDWVMLDPRYRMGPVGMDGDRAFFYSPSQRIRVRVEPISADYINRQAGRQQVFLEWRNGHSRLVIERGHRWHRVLPVDVTEEGRWVLLSVEEWNAGEDMGYMKSSYRELLAVDVLTGKRYSYVQSLEGVGPLCRFMSSPYEIPFYSFWRGGASR
ncbi:MAG: hypothetical protein KatS3mg016_0530 [Fimbriimonadales bacterium]|nr:MAG: hypothetical protein KatS3mg016_0530 [Fimbriimonadales bacterium]GIV10493.1 MAG: hypothetical protein KatS3mg019_2584 [Fimbriimonadales bacterium]